MSDEILSDYKQTKDQKIDLNLERKNSILRKTVSKSFYLPINQEDGNQRT